MPFSQQKKKKPKSNDESQVSFPYDYDFSLLQFIKVIEIYNDHYLKVEEKLKPV